MKQMMMVAVCLMVTACKNDQVEQWLTRAEGCMETCSDSAYGYLQYIDDADEWSDEQQARYALLRTQAMHKCRISLESDSLINVAVEYYANSDDRHRLALSLLYKGLVHKQNHQVEQAVKAFVGSEQAFDGVEDNQYKALLYNHYAALLMNQGVYEEALEYYEKTYQYELKGDSVHYVVSTYGQIAKLFELMNMPDSANSYYEQGLECAKRINKGNRKNYYSLLQSYASFLSKRKEYAHAERLLQECLVQITDFTYSYPLYSVLATLYYEKGVYVEALDYGKKILGSNDSLTLCGGYLRLYNIYKGMGEMDSALHYHNLYRRYHSDIVMRQQTAKVAAIPHRMQNVQLATENQALTGWRLWLAVALAVVSLTVMAIYIRIKRKHRLERAEKERELTESQTSLSDTKNLLAETKVNLGRLKGTLAHQSNAVNRMKNNLEELKKRHQEDIKRLKESIKKQEDDIQELKADNRSRNRSESELKRNVKVLEVELKKSTEKLQQVEHQREIDRRIEHFMLCGRDGVAVDMLLQLRQAGETVSRFDIKPSEYLPLLKKLLEQENPALHEQLENCGLEWKKLTMCYLMALGLDDVEMMARVACLSPNSVKAYRTQVMAALKKAIYTASAK